MSPKIDPSIVVEAVVEAVVRERRSAALFAESSSAMFYVTRAVWKPEQAPYVRFSSHYGSMGHGLAGAFGFCAATGKRAVVIAGDGSMDLLNPLRAAVKHRLTITIVVLNDARHGLPFFGTRHAKVWHAHKTTSLEPWDYTQQGSDLVRGARVSDIASLRVAITDAFSQDGCYVVDAQIDPEVVPPVGARLDGVDAMRGTADPVAPSFQGPDPRTQAPSAPGELGARESARRLRDRRARHGR